MPDIAPTVSVNSTEALVELTTPTESVVIINGTEVPVSVTESNINVNVSPSEEANVSVVPSENSVIISDGTNTQVVEIGLRGPQGPYGSAGRLDQLEDVDITGKVNDSVLVYSSSLGKFIANSSSTIRDIADGGNF